MDGVRAHPVGLASTDDPEHTWWRTWAGHVWASLPAVWMSALLAVVVDHGFRLDERLAHLLVPWIQDQAVLMLADERVAAAQSPAATPAVEVFTIPLLTVQRELEFKRDMSPATLLRLAGERPLDRARTAQLLQDLAQSLQQAKPAPARRVIGLDFDLVPLPEDSTSPFKPCLPGASPGWGDGQAADKMVDAMRSLRSAPGVAAVVMISRTRADSCEQRRRDAFVQRLQCTRHDAPATATAPLYIASSLVLKETDGRVVGYMYRAPAAQDKESGAHWPPLFPSLGTLAALAAEAHAGVQSHSAGQSTIHPTLHAAGSARSPAAPAPAATIDSDGSGSAADRAETLTFLCEQAHAAPGRQSPLYEAVLGPPDPQQEQNDAVVQAFAGDLADRRDGQRLINWLMLEPARLAVLRTPLPGIGPGDLQAMASTDAPVQILAMQGRKGADMHDRRVKGGPVDGALIHALAAAPGGALARPTAWQQLLEELAIGTVFVVLLLSLHLRLHEAGPLLPLRSTASSAADTAGVWAGRLRLGSGRAGLAKAVVVLLLLLGGMVLAGWPLQLGGAKLRALWQLGWVWQCFLLAWVLVVVVGLGAGVSGLWRGQRAAWVAPDHVLRNTTLLLLPLLVTLGVTGAILLTVTNDLTLPHAHLIDPALTLAGLTVHAYVEQGALAQAHGLRPAWSHKIGVAARQAASGRSWHGQPLATAGAALYLLIWAAVPLLAAWVVWFA